MIFTVCATCVLVVVSGAIALYIRRLKADTEKGRENSRKLLNAESVVLSKYIQHFAMVPAFRAYSKKEAIEKLVSISAEKFPEMVCNADHAKQAVFDREESMPTGLDNGIAVPHGRTDGVKQLIGVLAIVDNSENENGIIPDYETIDHSKIQILCLTLIPDCINTPYLQLIAAFIRILQDADTRDQLIACKTSGDMANFLHSIA